MEIKEMIARAKKAQQEYEERFNQDAVCLLYTSDAADD